MAQGAIVDQADGKTIIFSCPPELEPILPRPTPAVLGLPDWFKAMPQKTFNPSLGEASQTVKRCPPFIDAMTYGFLIPLATDLKVENGEFSWDWTMPGGATTGYAHSPIDFHDPSQVAGTPFHDDDRYVIKFNNFWTIRTPPGYSLLFMHPINRPDLPFRSITGLVDCDTFSDSLLNFPAHWHDAGFNGVLPKGTPVAQCLPVKREVWTADFEGLVGEAATRLNATREALGRETSVYRRQFRVPKH
jgi:hypothetical protein